MGLAQKSARVQTDPRKKPQTAWRLKRAKINIHIYYSTTIEKRKKYPAAGIVPPPF
nr:MAG TPA: hypothetical protein [Bacteriophage sp.]